MEIETPKILKKTILAQKTYKIICHEGGSRSGKTWSIFLFFLLKAYYGRNVTVTIVRDKLTWIKSTLLKDFEEITEKYGLEVTPEINPNRPEQIYKINGSEFAFFGLDYPQKLHGRKQDWFWINEVMEVDRKAFDQLEMRTTKGGIIDYNPSDDGHWIFEVQKRPDVTVIHSTMLNNPFLEKAIIDKIKSYEPTQENIQQGTADNYMWEVYGLGKKARLEGVIFTNWDIVEKIPEDASFKGFGLDFGYTNDPTALVALHMMDNEIYLDELMYEPGLTNQDITNKLKEMEISRNDLIVGDSAEPKSIEEIRRGGFYIKPSDKGADSIRNGIDLLKGYKIHITRRSSNLESELRKYKWAEDKTGKSLNVPVDANNHLIDSVRYLARAVLSVPTKRVFARKPIGF